MEREDVFKKVKKLLRGPPRLDWDAFDLENPAVSLSQAVCLVRGRLSQEERNSDSFSNSHILDSVGQLAVALCTDGDEDIVEEAISRVRNVDHAKYLFPSATTDDLRKAAMDAAIAAAGFNDWELRENAQGNVGDCDEQKLILGKLKRVADESELLHAIGSKKFDPLCLEIVIYASGKLSGTESGKRFAARLEDIRKEFRDAMPGQDELRKLVGVAAAKG